MKKWFWIILVIVVVVLLVVIAGMRKPKKLSLRLYNWADYYSEDVIRDFEKEFNCDVVSDTYASNEEMYAKLKAGASGYDVVFPSGDHVSIMIKHVLVRSRKQVQRSLYDGIHRHSRQQEICQEL